MVLAVVQTTGGKNNEKYLAKGPLKIYSFSVSIIKVPPNQLFGVVQCRYEDTS